MPAHGSMIMVATENTPIHTRLWCVFEAHMAQGHRIPITLVGCPASLAADCSAVVRRIEAEASFAVQADNFVAGAPPDACDSCCPSLKGRREAAWAAQEEKWRRSTPEQLCAQLVAFCAMMICMSGVVIGVLVWAATCAKVSVHQGQRQSHDDMGETPASCEDFILIVPQLRRLAQGVFARVSIEFNECI